MSENLNPIVLEVEEVRVVNAVSPTVDLGRTETGALVTVHDYRGTQTVEILDGPVGPVGPQGPQGESGAETAKAIVEEAISRMEDSIHDAQTIGQTVAGYRDAAAQSASNAALSKDAAAQSAQAAEQSNQSSSGYARTAGEQAENAAQSAQDASQSATAADTSARNAAQSETNAGNSASAASQSAQAASQSATNAAQSERNAADSAQDAHDVLDSIPEDYSTLSSDVTDLKSAVSRTLPILSKTQEGTSIDETVIDFPNVGLIGDESGNLIPTQTAYLTTDFLPLDNVTGIYRTGTTTRFTLWRYGFYDANQTCLGVVQDTESYEIETYNNKQVTWLTLSGYPNAKYIRISRLPYGTQRAYTYYKVTSVAINKYDVPNISITGVKPLKFYGKKIVTFGDSIFGNFRDTNETTDKSISKMIAEATGATVYNCGFGGCRMGYHSEKWRAFSMYALADAITTGVWTDQDNAVANPPGGMPAYFSDTLTMLKGIDFSKVDYITIGYGVNDYTGNAFINYASSLQEYQYFKGALGYSLRTILNTYPNIRIIVITPCWMWFPESSTGLLNYSSDDTESENTRGYKLKDYVNACESVCNEYHIPCINTYDELGFNRYSYTAYFNVKGIDGATVSDGTHPKQAGRQLRADRIVGQMEALY